MQSIQRRDKLFSVCLKIASLAICFSILKGRLHTVFPTKHIKQDCTEELFKGGRLSFSCLRCKLQISFLCCAEHSGLAWFLRQCTWASSFWTVWNKAQRSQVGDVVDGYREGKENLSVSTALLNTGKPLQRNEFPVNAVSLFVKW